MTRGRHCKPPFVAREGKGACAHHTHCARHWRHCDGCASSAARTVPLAFTDPLRQIEAKRIARESALAAAQVSLPLEKR